MTLKTSDRDTVPIRTVSPASGQITEVDVVACHGVRRVRIAVANLTHDELATAWVSIEDARVLAAHLNRLIKRADRARQKESRTA